MSHVLPFAERLDRSQNASERCHRDTGLSLLGLDAIHCAFEQMMRWFRIFKLLLCAAVTVLQLNCSEGYQTVQLTAVSKLQSWYLKLLCVLNLGT